MIPQGLFITYQDYHAGNTAFKNWFKAENRRKEYICRYIENRYIMCRDDVFILQKPLRGSFKYLVLQVLKEKPLHGYGVIQEIEKMFNGQYAPSPGIVYPTLQLLEDIGYVKSSVIDGKKFYTITEDGKRALEENAHKIHELIKHTHNIKKFMIDLEGLELIKAMKKLFKHLPELSEDKMAEIKRLFSDFRHKLIEIIEH